MSGFACDWDLNPISSYTLCHNACACRVTMTGDLETAETRLDDALASIDKEKSARYHVHTCGFSAQKPLARLQSVY